MDSFFVFVFSFLISTFFSFKQVFVERNKKNFILTCTESFRFQGKIKTGEWNFPDGVSVNFKSYSVRDQVSIRAHEGV